MSTTTKDHPMREVEFTRTTPYGRIKIPVSVSETFARDEPFLAAVTAVQMADEAEVFAVEQRAKEQPK